MLLGVLEAGPLHGYAIIESLTRRGGGSLELPAHIYPALHRLERAGLLSSSWTTVGGRPRRSYSLTEAGGGRLQAERVAWRQFTRTIGAVLGEGPA